MNPHTTLLKFRHLSQCFLYLHREMLFLVLGTKNMILNLKKTENKFQICGAATIFDITNCFSERFKANEKVKMVHPKKVEEDVFW